MAETYKGLTIRIGGDTTRLQSAMKSADSAISSTQTMLNKLTRALKFDGADASGLNRQMDLLANKASESYAAIDRLRKSVEHIRNQKVQLFDGTDSSRSIQRYIDDLKAASDGTVDLAANAAEAREQYNRLNAELEQIYRAINKSAKESEQFEKGFDIRKQVDNLDELESKLLSTGAATEEQIALIRELRPQWQAAFDENQFAQAAAGLDEANNRIEVLKANAKQAANQFADMSAQMSRVQFSGSLDEQLKQVSVQSDRAADNLSRLQKALDIDPSNYETFNATSKQISENIELAQRRATLLRQAIEQLNSRGTAEVTDDMRRFADSTEDAEQKLRAAANEVTQLRGELSEARNALKLAEKEADTLPEKFDEASSQVSELQSRLRQATDNMERMNSVASAFRGSDELSEYNVELRETEALISRLNAQKSDMGSIGGLSLDALMTMGMTLSTTVTPAIIQMGQYAVEAAVDIDTAYRDMRKTVNGTEQDFEALRQAAIDFSTQNVTSADTMLSIQAIGGELGVATDSLKSFSEVVSNLDVATNLNAEEAATQLGQLANIMHMTESDYVSFGDALVRLGNNGASTESQIADIATRIGSMGSIIGMSTPDVLAWASTIASTGQNAEAAGTAISNTMSDIETAVSAGGDSLEAFAQVSQMSAEDFSRAWEEDPTTALKAFIEGLNAIEDAGGSADATLGALDINAARQKQAIMGLMQTIDMLDDNLQMSQNAWDGISDEWGSAGDAAEEAGRKAEGFSGSLSILQNSVQVIGSEIANSFAPMLGVVADAVGDFAQSFTEVDDSTKQAIATFAGIAAAVGPVLMYVRALTSAGGSLSKMFAKLKGANSVVNGLSKAFEGMSLSVGAVGITALVSGMAILVSKMAEVQRNIERTDKATNGLSESVSGLTSKLHSGARDVDDFSRSVFDATYNVNDAMQANIDMAESIADIIDEAEGQISALGQAQTVIGEYLNQTGLTTTEQGRLRSAISLVNDECETQYQVVDAANGKIADEKGQLLETVDAIGQYIKAKQAQIRVDSLQESLSAATKTQQEQTKNLITARENYQAALDDFNETWGEYEEGTGNLQMEHDWGFVLEQRDNFEKTADAAREAGEAVDSLNADIGLSAAVLDGTASAVQEFVANNADLAAGLSVSEQGMADFSDALERAGVSVEDLNGLSEEELQDLSSNFDGTVSSIVESLGEMGRDIPAQGLAIMLGLSDGIEQGTEDVINAALRASDMTLEQFITSAHQFGLAGESQIAAYAQGLANGDTATVAAMKALQTANALGAYLQQFGIEGDAAIQAFINAINAGDTFDAALQKAREAASGIQSGQPEMEQSASTAAHSTASKLNDKGGVDLFGSWYNFAMQIGSAISSAGSWLMQQASNVVNSVLNILSGGSRSVSAAGSRQSYTGQHVPRSVSARSAMPVQYDTAEQAANISVQDMQQLAKASVKTSAVRLQSVPDLASRAANLATAYRQGAVSTMSRGEGSIGNAGALMSTRNGAATTQNVNVTIDGTGTTARIERITLELLDELERLGAI